MNIAAFIGRVHVSWTVDSGQWTRTAPAAYTHRPPHTIPQDPTSGKDNKSLAMNMNGAIASVLGNLCSRNC